MSGTINTLQKCPSCGGKFPPSKGDFPIICYKCKTQPTKFIIKLYWRKKRFSISRDEEGKTIHSWNHASNLLGHIRSEIQKKSFDPDIYKEQSSTSFSAFWDRFIYKYRNNAATHAKLMTIGKFHLKHFMRFQMRDIRAYHIDEWWEKLKDKNLSPHYMNDIQQWLKRFMNEARELDIIEKVPRFPEPMDRPRKEIKYLSSEDQDKILEHIPDHDKYIFDFLYMTGVRVGEAIGLQRSSIDFNRGRTIIQHTIKLDRKTLGPTKNKHPRVIPHFGGLEDCLKNAIKQSGPQKFVFTNKWGRIYTADYLRDTFDRACLKAGVKRVQLKNATRHSFGMRMIGSGVDIWKTSKAMGHSDIKMTENYVDMLADQLKSAYEQGQGSKNVARVKSANI